MYKDDGDIIKGLGYVVMHAAHLEGRIDSLLDYLALAKLVKEKDFRLPISIKIKNLISIFEKYSEEWTVELTDDLNSCLERFEWRNEVVHGRIYSPEYTYDNLESGRRNEPSRRAESKELYDLANDLRDLDACIYRPQQFKMNFFISTLIKDL